MEFVIELGLRVAGFLGHWVAGSQNVTQFHLWTARVVCVVAAVVVLQAAAVATFGGFAHSDYGATPTRSDHYTYLGWCYWAALAGAVLTALAAVCLIAAADCCAPCRRRRSPHTAGCKSADL